MKRSQIKTTKEELKKMEITQSKTKNAKAKGTSKRNLNQAAEQRNKIIYCSELLRKGWSNRTIVLHLAEKFDVTEKTARDYIKKAVAWLGDLNSDSNFVQEIRAKQIERSEYILEAAIEDRKWKDANNILDNLNKLFGLYETKQKVEITSNEIQFKFGGVENNEDKTDVSE